MDAVTVDGGTINLAVVT